MGRLVAVIVLTGCILSFTFFSSPVIPSTNRLLKDKKNHTVSEVEFTYEIEELHTFPSPEEAKLSITGGVNSIEFNQKFICYMGGADIITLEKEKQWNPVTKRWNTITIKEIWPLELVPHGTALYNVTGKIQGLEEDDYTVKFVYIDHSQGTTTKLYKRTVHVSEEEDGDAFVSPLVLGSLSIVVVAIIVVVLAMYFKKKQRS